jgi:acyl carrier protein
MSERLEERNVMPTVSVIKQFIASKLRWGTVPSTLGDQDPLVESGIIDSFGVMSLITFIEKEFGISLSGDDLIPENFETVAAIGDLVDRKVGGPGGSA